MYKKIKKVAKFLQSSKEASNSEDWQECIDMANKALKNEPTIENVRFHAHDRYILYPKSNPKSHFPHQYKLTCGYCARSINCLDLTAQ